MGADDDGEELEPLPALQPEDHPAGVRPTRRRGYAILVLGTVAVTVVVSIGITAALRTRVHELDTEIDGLRSQLATSGAEVEGLRDRLATSEAGLVDLRAERYVTVPNLVGIRFREAKAILLAAGLPTSPDPDNLNLIVLRQRPEPGVRVVPGTGVVLVTQ